MNNTNEKTVVAVGCSTWNDYAFLMPLTCLFWRDHIRFSPLALLVGREEDWIAQARTAVALRALDEHQISRVFVGLAEGYPDYTMAQNVRQHATACPDISPETWVMPADADLWPLRRSYYQHHEGTGYKAVCYYANGDHFKGKEDVLERAARGLCSQTIPTCHVAMRAADWRSIYGIDGGGDYAGCAKKTLDAWFAVRAKEGDHGMVQWMSDQQIMTEALCHQVWFPGMAKMIERRGHPPLDRLCRSVPERWQELFDASKWVDAHVHKNPDAEGNWRTLLPIVESLMPQHADWARDYREAYARRVGQ